MNSIKYHTYRTDLKSNWKIVETGKIDTTNTHTYKTDHFPCLVQVLQYIKLIYGPQPLLFMKQCGHTSVFHMGVESQPSHI
jgi:hypothetical protein